ncbi:MAG TPA: hypothetical protein VI733_04935 [Candidatus Limnocylindria bacterium]|nr:hypothetical protein [Candidatus Limnocylindria bacterium]
MYSPRQRDVRERRIHERDERRFVDPTLAVEVDEGMEFEAPSSWSAGLGARASAA